VNEKLIAGGAGSPLARAGAERPEADQTRNAQLRRQLSAESGVGVGVAQAHPVMEVQNTDQPLGEALLQRKKQRT
jgi:hypothetical protein